MTTLQVKLDRPSGFVSPSVRKLVNGEMVEVRRYPKTSNAVANGFFKYLFAGSDKAIFNNNAGFEAVIRRFRVGTGTAPITSTSTSLGNQESAAQGVQQVPCDYTGEYINGKWYIKLTLTYVFPLGGLQGNYTEFGTFSTDTSTTLRTGGLFKDTAGDPVAISVSSDEQLIITYEILIPTEEQSDPSVDRNDYIYVPVGTTTVNVDGVDYTATVTSQWLRLMIMSGNLDRLAVSTPQGSDYTRSRINGSNANDSSTNYNVSGFATLTDTGGSWTYSLTIAPTAGITEINNIDFGRIYSGSTRVDFDPPIPIPEGNSVAINFEINLDWS